MRTVTNKRTIVISHRTYRNGALLFSPPFLTDNIIIIIIIIILLLYYIIIIIINIIIIIIIHHLSKFRTKRFFTRQRKFVYIYIYSFFLSLIATR